MEYPNLKNKQRPLLHLKMTIIQEKPQTDSYSTFSRKGTRRIKKIPFPELQSEEKDSSTSYIGVESSQVSTENDHLSNVVSNLTPE